MFNKLVVSTDERRGNRTARFFFGTAIIYTIVVAFAFAISIFVANPRMADTSKIILIAPPPPDRRPHDIEPGRPEPKDRPRQNPNSVRGLDYIIRHPETAPVTARPTGPPRADDVRPIEGGGGDAMTGGIEKSIGVPGGHEKEIGQVAPPPEAPTPVHQPRAADNRQPLKLTSTVLQGKATVRRAPDYPPLAKQIRLEGAVSVEVMIALDGRVESARAVSGHPLFIKAAVDSAYGWRFEPTLLNGAPVRVTGIITFNFKLN
ncbi:MAG TPA: TonB family protein [Blastocatellia bacterium]|jgi:protein TonB